MMALTAALQRLGMDAAPLAVWIGGEATAGTGSLLTGRSPIDGTTLCSFAAAAPSDLPRVLAAELSLVLERR